MDEAMARGDFAMFYTDDVVAHLGGDRRVSGDYRGVAHIQRLFGRFMEASGECVHEHHAYLADDEDGVILQRGTMKRDERSFSTNEVCVYPFRDRKIAEFWCQAADRAGLDSWWGR
jgi:ketosteroid isomerase-like protein